MECNAVYFVNRVLVCGDTHIQRTSLAPASAPLHKQPFLGSQQTAHSPHHACRNERLSLSKPRLPLLSTNQWQSRLASRNPDKREQPKAPSTQVAPTSPVGAQPRGSNHSELQGLYKVERSEGGPCKASARGCLKERRHKPLRCS
jgi:hypothetical protein